LDKNLAELAPRFWSDLAGPIKQNHSNPDPIGISRILRMRSGQRWPEDGMPKCEVIYCQALKNPVFLRFS